MATFAAPHELSEKGPQLRRVRPDGWPLGGGLVGGKFGGIDFVSRLVLLFRAVEFEDAVDVDLGDPMQIQSGVRMGT
jgi:hypothetical protein